MNLIFFLNVFTSPKKNTLHLPDSYTQTNGLVLIKISLCRFHCGLYLTHGFTFIGCVRKRRLPAILNITAK